MFRFLSYVVLTSALLLAFATPLTQRAMSIHEKRTLSGSFTASGKPAIDTILNLRVALTAVNMTGLEAVLYDVSTPSSAQYGQHLSLDEVRSYASPTPETVAAVTAWLHETSGVSNISTTGAFGNWITFSADIPTANSLLNADFETFTHITTGSTMIRTLSYSIPQDLLQHIDLVHPTTSFARLEKTSMIKRHTAHNVAARADAAPASCNKEVTPTCLQDLYAIPTTRATQTSNKIAVAGFSDQWPQDADLKLFLTDFRPDMSPDTTFTLQSISDGVDPQGAGFAGEEADFDVQYTVGIATNVPVVFMSVGPADSGPDEFLELVEIMNSETSPPQVLTTSYAFNEEDVGAPLATVMCNSYMTLGVRGVSILFSSGDGGVAGITSESCTTFLPAFPATCPYVTSVGATENVPEAAGSFSAGGFSNIFPIPSYQEKDVSSYTSRLGSTYTGLYNATGRGFPDVSAQGVEVAMAFQGGLVSVFGTSCSSPIFASVISLINDRLIAAGKPVLGFLNPFLYANSKALFDITTGDNPGCNTNGFSATVGWDPATGLGTPSFSALLAAAGL